MAAINNGRGARWLAPVSAGQLTTYGELQEYKKTILPSGNAQDSWITLDGIWMDVLPFSPERLYFAQQVPDTAVAYVKIRYRTDVKIGMRIITEQNTFTVQREPLDLEYKHVSCLLFCYQS